MNQKYRKKKMLYLPSLFCYHSFFPSTVHFYQFSNILLLRDKMVEQKAPKLTSSDKQTKITTAEQPSVKETGTH